MIRLEMQAGVLPEFQRSTIIVIVFSLSPGNVADRQVGNVPGCQQGVLSATGALADMLSEANVQEEPKAKRACVSPSREITMLCGSNLFITEMQVRLHHVSTASRALLRKKTRQVGRWEHYF